MPVVHDGGARADVVLQRPAPQWLAERSMDLGRRGVDWGNELSRSIGVCRSDGHWGAIDACVVSRNKHKSAELA